MTVNQLIQELQKLDGNLLVVLGDLETNFASPLDHVSKEYYYKHGLNECDVKEPTRAELARKRLPVVPCVVLFPED